MPRFRSIGFMPKTTYFMPSYTMDCVSTVAVVVPSPTLSLVFDSISLIVCVSIFCSFFFFQAEDGIRDDLVTGVQTLLFRSHAAAAITRRRTLAAYDTAQTSARQRE